MKKLIGIVVLCILCACSGPDVRQYQAAEPKLDLAQFFVGTTDAWGMFQKRSGEVTKRFHVEITGTLADGTLTLDEQFKYDDGTKQQRIWRLKRTADGIWHGQAADVKGEALGEIAGNALRWKYTLLLPVDGSTYEMQFDDWMFLMDEKSMINRASMSKLGVELGQITLFFRKRV